MDQIIIANIVRLRAIQAAVVALLAAAYVTSGDIKALIVGREPIISTHYPPVHYTGRAVASVTSPPALIPSTWSTDPVEDLLYGTKTVLRDSPSTISVTLNLPTVGTLRPSVPTSLPEIPTKTTLTVYIPIPPTSTARPHGHSTTSENRNDGDSSYLASPQNYWIVDSIRGAFSGLKERVHIVAANTFDFVKLARPSSTTAKDRKIYELNDQIKECANLTMRAATVAEVAQNDKSRAETEIARLRSITEERQRALTKYQWACKKKLEEAAEDAVRSLEEKDGEMEMAMEKASEALQEAKDQAKDDATREIRHLTDLATQQHAEAAEQRKADEATINALQDQRTAEANTIRELSNQVISNAQKDEKIAALLAQTQSLTKAIKDLTQELDRLAKSGIDAETALKATIGRLSANLELANKRSQAAEAIASYQEALVVQAREEQRLAEERAEKLEAQAAKAEAKKKAAEEKASREKARMEAKKSQEAWQAQKELKKLYQQDHTCSEVSTPSRDLSLQKSSLFPHSQPAVHIPTFVAAQKDVYAAQNELVPLYDRPTKTKGKTTPEERGLLADTPTEAKAERWEGENEEE